MEPQLVPLADAARALGIGLATLRSLVAAGQIATVHVGRRHLAVAASVRDYAARLAASSPAEGRAGAGR